MNTRYDFGRAVLLALLMVLPVSTLPSQTGASLSRVATIGASLTGGFCNGLPIARLFDSAIKVEHTRILRCFSSLFFKMPISTGRTQIDRCLRHEPTLVIAVDFLFWYGYGYVSMNRGELDSRLARLEQGLAQLDRLGCPVVVGDFPDMTGAHRWMISKSQIPGPAALNALNQRLRQWARGRNHVLVVPLGAWVRGLKSGAWKIPAPADGKGEEKVLTMEVAMQWDRLHPTKIGAVFLAEKLVKAMHAHFEKKVCGLELDAMQMIKALGLEDLLRQ